MLQKKLGKKKVTLKRILLAIMLVIFIVLTAKYIDDKTKEAVTTENADTTKSVARNYISNNSYQQ